MKTLQEQYNLIKEGRGNKEILLKTAKQLYPNVIPNHFTYNQAVPLLKQRGLLHESIGGVVTKGKDPDWFSIFKKNTHNLTEAITPEDLKVGEIYEYSGEITLGPKAGELATGTLEYVGKYSEQLYRFKWISVNHPNLKVGNFFVTSDEGLQYLSGPMGHLRHLAEAKAIEKKPTKDVVDMETKGYDYKNKENIDNIYGQAFLIGYYAEMKDPANADKTVDDLKAIVAKNLYKDPLYYVKNGQFGVKGVGYTDEAPGLKASKTDQMTPVPDQVKPKASKTDLGDREKKTGAAKKVKGEMTITPKSSKGVKKMPLPGKEKKIKLQEAWDTMGPGYGEDIYDNMEKVAILLKNSPELTGIDNKDVSYRIEGDKIICKDRYSLEKIQNALSIAEIEYVYKGNLIIKIGDDDINPAGSRAYLQEQKIRSIISQIIKEELEEAWEGAEFDTGKFDDGPQPPDDMSPEMMWNSLSPDMQEELLMSYIKDPDEAIFFVGKEWDSIPDDVTANILNDDRFFGGIDLDENIEEGAMDDQIAAAEKIVAQKKKEAADAEIKAANLKKKEADTEASS